MRETGSIAAIEPGSCGQKGAMGVRKMVPRRRVLARAASQTI